MGSPACALDGAAGNARPPGSNPLALRVCGIGGTSIANTIALDPGATAFYLVSGTAGGVESGLGVTSDGIARPNDDPCAGF